MTEGSASVDGRAGTTRVAFIGGHGRSGSTLLGRMLAGVDGVCSVGELRNLWDVGVLRDRNCACGKPFSQCEFWTSVGQEAFDGWDAETARTALHLRRRVDRVRAVPRLSRAGNGDFDTAADTYADMLAAVYTAAATVTGAKVVVDSSKVPSTGYLMQRSARLEPRVIHLVRDSRGVAFSWTKVVHRGDAERTMARSTPARTAVRWEAFNLLTARLRSKGVPVRLVRYEDLVRDPRTEVSRLVDFLDVPEADLSFLGGESVLLPQDHSVWGNPMRSASGPQRLRLDAEWRTGLGRGQRALVTTISVSGLRRYGYIGRSVGETHA